MADWRTELEALLTHLQVAYDDERAASADAGAAPMNDSPAPERSRKPPAKRPAPPNGPATGHIPSRSGRRARPKKSGQGAPETPADDEVSAVRSEVEATIRQVASLARAGRMERALRDDVVYVLQALTRPAPPPPASKPPLPAEDDAAGEPQEWNLASAAAVLHFCRIVSRLTNALAQDGSDAR